MTGILFISIMIFKSVNDTSVVAALFTAANYTYGPLLGLFFFGLISKRIPADKLIPYVAIIAPILCYFLEYSLNAKYGFSFGFAGLGLNSERLGFSSEGWGFSAARLGFSSETLGFSSERFGFSSERLGLSFARPRLWIHVCMLGLATCLDQIGHPMV